MIRVENVSKTFVLHQQNGVRLPVLHSASLDVSKGECVVLHGHSGSGQIDAAALPVRQLSAGRRPHLYSSWQ